MKKIYKRIIIGVIIATLSSCASSKKGHYDLWDSYKTCAAYGNP